jgi:hypothetical protein
MRIAILGRATLHYIGNEDLGTLQTDLLQQAIQQFASRANEGNALFIFVVPRRFAHQHNGGLRLATAAHHLCAACRQGTLLAVFNGVMEGL